MTKFNSDLDEQVYGMEFDHTFGQSIDGIWNGWITAPMRGIVAVWIIEDSQGFVSCEYARTVEELTDMWVRFRSDRQDYEAMELVNGEFF